MNTPRLNLFTDGGRLVAGSVFKPSLTDNTGKPRAKPTLSFALAISKTSQNFGQMFGQMYNFAMQCYGHYPHIAQRIQQVNQIGFNKASQFAWKIKDGDSPELVNRPGHAGCWVIWFSTTITIRCVDVNNNPIDPAQVKTGYYADVAFNVAPNGKTDHTSGLYLNPNIVRLLGYTEEITPGPSAEQAFGGVGRAMGQAAPIGQGVPGGMPPAPNGSFTGYGQAQQGYQPAPQGYNPALAAAPTPQGFGGVMQAPATFPAAGGALGYAPAGHVPAGGYAAQQAAGYPGMAGTAPGSMGAQSGYVAPSTPGMGGPQPAQNETTVHGMLSALAAPSLPTMPQPPQAQVGTPGAGVMGNDPAHAQAVPAGASPVGAVHTDPQQALPIASPSSVPGFAHGAPQA